MSFSSSDFPHREITNKQTGFAVLKEIFGIKWKKEIKEREKESRNICVPKEVISDINFADKLTAVCYNFEVWP